jgi:hypothetical protein
MYGASRATMLLPTSAASMANSTNSSAPAVVIFRSSPPPSAIPVSPRRHRLHSPPCRPHERFHFEPWRPQDARLRARSDRTTRPRVGPTSVTLSDRGTRDSKVEDTGANTTDVHSCFPLFPLHNTRAGERGFRESLDAATDGPKIGGRSD